MIAIQEKVKRVSASEMAKRWGLSLRRVRVLCAEGKIFAARRGADGIWTIPVTADRPIDGRSHRYRKIPPNLRDLVRHADAVLERTRRAGCDRSAEERWLFFLRGSAFHLHTLGRSSLTLANVCAVIAGGKVDGKSGKDQEEVLRHCRALEHVVKAVRDHRRLSTTLVLEVARLLGEPRVRYARDKDKGDVELLVHQTLCSRAHPIVKAGNFLTEMFIQRPFVGNNERIGYMIANFLLLQEEYPPVILFRRIFKTVDDYHRRFRARCRMDRQLVAWGIPDWGPSRMPPAVRSAFLNACVIRAVVRSCRYGLLMEPGDLKWPR